MEIIVKYSINTENGILTGINTNGNIVKFQGYLLNIEKQKYEHRLTNGAMSNNLIHIANCEEFNDDKTATNRYYTVLEDTHKILYIVNQIELEGNFVKIINDKK